MKPCYIIMISIFTGNALKPYLNTFKGLGNLLSWKSPAYTFLVFVVCSEMFSLFFYCSNFALHDMYDERQRLKGYFIRSVIINYFAQ